MEDAMTPAAMQGEARIAKLAEFPFPLLVRSLFGFLQKSAKRILDLSKDEWEMLEKLAVQLKDADEQERLEILETMTEVAFPQEAIGGVAIGSGIDQATQQKVQDYQRSIGLAIKDARKKKKLTQQSLAKKARLPQSHISRLESGEYTPTDVTVERIAVALGVTPDLLDPGWSK